jgi:hypothetical protein
VADVQALPAGTFSPAETYSLAPADLAKAEAAACSYQTPN